MSRCHGCGGVIGRDCFNPQECEQITRDMAASSLSMYDQSFVDALQNELDSLKKVYNDLAESHAKQVIEIGELQDINLSQKKQLLHYEINVLASKDAELEKLESELLKAKEEINQLKITNELLKEPHNFCQCDPDDKTGSTSAMHCNHCGKIEQSETWLK